jgi:IS5 family transposase
MDAYVNENLLAKYFVGLAVNVKVPDDCTLSVFRERLVQNGKTKIFEELLDSVVKEARTRGCEVRQHPGSGQLLNGTHSAPTGRIRTITREKP